MDISIFSLHLRSDHFNSLIQRPVTFDAAA
jgi:hypothetical protein